MNGDKCSACGQFTMPRIADSLATARVCQTCGFVEELRPDVGESGGLVIPRIEETGGTIA